MGASSVTGVSGPGTSNGFLGPVIIVSGLAISLESLILSPTAYVGNVILPQPLPGGSSGYLVFLTINGGYAYIVEMIEDADGNFSEFSFITESECTAMYMVTKAGMRIFS